MSRVRQFRATDTRLGRHIEFDDQSRNYPVRSLLPISQEPKKKSWRCDPRLNQGQTPKCVGFAWTEDHAAEPQRHRVNDMLPHQWYKVAQEKDGITGPHDGSTTLGGAKAGVQLGFFKEYRWCFGLEDLIRTVSSLGPVLVGTNWYRSMFDPDENGVISISGPLDGGHEWCIRGVNPRRELFLARQTWGRSWGLRGDFLVPFDAMQLLLVQDGDACYPVREAA